MTVQKGESKLKFMHVGVAVENIEQAIEFYKVFLQAEPLSTFENDRTPFIDELVGYEATMREAWFPLGDGYLELLEYSLPEPGRTNPETYNVGHMHFCIEVEDLEAEYQRLRDADIGIEFRSDGPVVVPEEEAEFKNERYLYLRTPDGSTFEFFQPAPEA